MPSGTAAGAVKPRTLVALEVIGVDCLRAGDFHDVQGTSQAPIQDEYTVAAVIRFDACIEIKNSAQRYRHHLTRESIHEGSSPSLSTNRISLLEIGHSAADFP